MKIFIAPKLNKPDTKRVLGETVDVLRSLGMEIVDNLADCDVVITIGGDGTILRTGKDAANAKKPLLGINTGRLGFMATLESDELKKLERLKTGDYKISRRVMLKAAVNKKSYLFLNDIVLRRGVNSKMPEFTVTRDKTVVLRIRADGIIISSPTGSTAYSLSAGGAIIEPEMECMELTALCPHTLFNRSMIFSVNSSLSMDYADCDGVVSVNVDGDDVIELPENETVIISLSSRYLDLIDIEGNNFYNSIHNKLMKPLK